MRGLTRYLLAIVRVEMVLAGLACVASLVGIVGLLLFERERVVDIYQAQSYREYALTQGVDAEALSLSLAGYAKEVTRFERDGRRWLRCKAILDAQALVRTAGPAFAPPIVVGTDIPGVTIELFKSAMLGPGLAVQLILLAVVGWRLGRSLWPRASSASWRLGLAAGLGASVVGTIAIAALERLGYLVEASPLVADALRRGEWGWVALVALVLAPIGEELFFRGWAFERFRRLGSERRAIAISALIFAAAHLDLPALPIYFFYGVLLAWLYARSGRLIAPIVAHATINAVALLLARFG